MENVAFTIHGRGAATNPANRFQPLDVVVEPDDWFDPADNARPPTVYLDDHSRSIIVQNDSPDVGFTFSINPYRGCEHGCIYCYARPTHEYLGMSAGLDFETKIFVKRHAAKLLREELSNRRWKPTTLAMSGVTDCYQPVEKKLQITRKCLEVCAEFRNPIGIVTKNGLVTRDMDLLSELARHNAAVVYVSVTTLDADLSRKMEPRTCAPQKRLKTIETLSKAGIPVGMMMAPVIPGLTDHEMPAVLQAAADAGACCGHYVPVRLPLAVAPLFEEWLGLHFPDRKDKVLNRIRELRGGKLNDSNFGTRMRGFGVWAEQFKTLFEMAKRRAGLDGPGPRLSTAAFHAPMDSKGQMNLW